MSNILALTSSALGEASVSNRLVRETVAALRENDPAMTVTARDIGAEPVPHLTVESATALRGEPANAAQAEARALSDTLVGEVQAADTLVIGAPMYNFGIPSTLKAWFDYVLRAGVTFRYTEAGPEGLLKGKRAIVVVASGGTQSGSEIDFATNYLKHVLGFVGISDVEIIAADQLGKGAEDKLASASGAIEALAA